MEKCLLHREENADFKSRLGGLDIGELALQGTIRELQCHP